MALIRIKPGVEVSQQVVIACAVVNAATTLLLPDMVITSGREGTHQAGSFHYQDRALDIRTKHLTRAQKLNLVDAVAARLGSEYDVILEALGKTNEHLHVEYDAPRPTVRRAQARKGR